MAHLIPLRAEEFDPSEMINIHHFYSRKISIKMRSINFMIQVQNSIQRLSHMLGIIMWIKHRSNCTTMEWT